MSAATILRRPLPPQKISAHDNLVRALSDYEKSVKDIEFARVKVKEAQAASEAAFTDQSLSDQEVWDRSQAVEMAMSTSSQREAGVKPALERFEKSIAAAQHEYSNLYAEKRTRMRRILGGKAFKEFGVPVELYERFGYELDNLETYSEPLEELRTVFEPVGFNAIVGNPDLSVQFAKDLLKKFELLNAQKVEKI